MSNNCSGWDSTIEPTGKAHTLLLTLQLQTHIN